jgi:hypothetical protein
VAEPPWVNETEAPPRPTIEQALAFFGVPPDPPQQLEDNIARKQRSWRLKLRERRHTAVAVRKVEQVLETIDVIADVARSMTGPQPGDLPAMLTESLHMPVALARHLPAAVDRLLAHGRVAEALGTAYDAYVRFDAVAITGASLARAIARAIADGTSADARLRRLGIEAGLRALKGGARDDRLIEAMATLIAGMPPEIALRHVNDLREALGPTAIHVPLLTEGCVAAAALGRLEEAADLARLALALDPDEATRLTIVEALVAAAQQLLPLAAHEELVRYSRLVEVAAWCAHGSASAEAIARPHRLWAAQAGSHLSMEGRAAGLVTVLFGFLPQPLVVALLRTPQWEILHKGPEGSDRGDLARVMDNPLVDQLHRSVVSRFEWPYREYAA